MSKYRKKPQVGNQVIDELRLEPRKREEKGPVLPFDLLISIRSAMEIGVSASQIILIVDIQTTLHVMLGKMDGEELISRLKAITTSIRGDMENTKKQADLAERVRAKNGSRRVAGIFKKDKK